MIIKTETLVLCNRVEGNYQWFEIVTLLYTSLTIYMSLEQNQTESTVFMQQKPTQYFEMKRLMIPIVVAVRSAQHYQFDWSCMRSRERASEMERKKWYEFYAKDSIHRIIFRNRLKLLNPKKKTWKYIAVFTLNSSKHLHLLTQLKQLHQHTCIYVHTYIRIHTNTHQPTHLTDAEPKTGGVTYV